MSGDPGLTEPVIFYTTEMTLAKRILLRHHTHTVQTKEEFQIGFELIGGQEARTLLQNQFSAGFVLHGKVETENFHHRILGRRLIARFQSQGYSKGTEGAIPSLE